MRRSFVWATVLAGAWAATFASISSAGDDAGAGAGASEVRAALRFTEWTMIHTSGNVTGIDPSVVIGRLGQSEKQMMLMSCVDRPFGSYTHICAMFKRCAEVPKETWATVIGEPPPNTLLAAACAYPLHVYVVRQDGDRLVALRRKMRRVNRDAGDAGAPDGGALLLTDPFCKNCFTAPVEDWQESRSLRLAPGENVIAGPAERRQRRWDLD